MSKKKLAYALAGLYGLSAFAVVTGAFVNHYSALLTGKHTHDNPPTTVIAMDNKYCDPHTGEGYCCAACQQRQELEKTISSVTQL